MIAPVDPLVHWLLRAALALLFASAARHKLADRAAFRRALAAYRLLPPALVATAAVVIPAAEIALAASLLAPAPAATVGGVGVVALLAGYAAAIAINLVRGRTAIDCGCGGPDARQPIGWWLVVRNAGLAAAAAATLAPTAPRSLHWIDGLTFAGGLAVLAGAWTAAHGLAAAAARVRGRLAAVAEQAS